ncbi:MAG: flagellar basal body L-ring protein FlgH [Desulfovermiculus sp.]
MRWIWIGIICFALMGCAAKKPEWGPEYELPEDTYSDQEDGRPASPGSLWPDSRESMYADNKANNPGDIVTVAIYEQASANRDADTSTGRESSVSAGLTNFFGLENSDQVAKNLDLSNMLQGSTENSFSGSGSTSRSEDLSATITTQVVSVLPNGNLRIQGRKRVTVNNEEQYIGLSGVVRPEDITNENEVDSRYVLDAEIMYTGRGPLSDKQQPGWFMRAMDNVWPF